MKQICLFAFIFFLINDIKSQNKDSCSCCTNQKVIDSLIKKYRTKRDIVCNKERTNVEVFVKNYPYKKVIYIDKDSLLNGFKLEIADTSFKLIGFRIFFEFPGDPFGEEIILDNKVTPQNLGFLPHIKGYGEGYFEFTCITIEKKGKKYNAPNFVIMLSDK